MKIISTKVHGVIDYVVGVFLTASPWILGFAGTSNTGRDDTFGEYGSETYIPVIMGILLLVYSMFTNYELGLARRITMKTHLVLDFCSGVFLAASPWLFNFADHVQLPHLIIGLLEIGAALFTNAAPQHLGKRSLGGATHAHSHHS